MNGETLIYYIKRNYYIIECSELKTNINSGSRVPISIHYDKID